MKVFVFKDYGGIKLFANKQAGHTEEYGYVFLGTLDLDIQPEKKTVVKEVKIGDDLSSITAWNYGGCVNYELPSGAKNKKLTYEVEE